MTAAIAFPQSVGGERGVQNYSRSYCYAVAGYVHPTSQHDSSSAKAQAYADLLHVVGGVSQDPSGAYPGRPQSLSHEQIRDHLDGTGPPIALAVGFKTQDQKYWARFAAFDIDQRFEARLAILKEVIKDLDIGSSTFVTPGSGPDKGKIVICFKEPVERKYAWMLLETILLKAHDRDQLVIPDKPADGDLELYPKNGTKESGRLRILGRNRFRGGPVEQPLSLDGVPLDLTAVRPLSSARLRAKVSDRYLASLGDYLPKTILDLIRKPWPRSTRIVVKKISRLVHYFYDRWGIGGHDRYRRALTEVQRNSPQLNDKSNTGDTRNPVQRELDDMDAWGGVLKGHQWVPKAAKPCAATRVRDQMLAYVRENGLMPSCFFVSYRDLATRLGVVPSAVTKSIRKAEQLGLIAVLVRGSKSSFLSGKVVHGRANLYALIGEGESRESVIAMVKGDPVYEKALAHRASDGHGATITDTDKPEAA